MKNNGQTQLVRNGVLWACLFLPTIILAQNTGKADFFSPHRGTTIREAERTRFDVKVQVNQIDPLQHYWVAIATVMVDEREWEHFLTQYNPNKEPSPKMLQLMKSWDIREFWPKFSVKKSPKRGVMHDGGTNGLAGEEPQPMMLICFRADDNFHKRIKRWFREGQRTGNYPGFSGSILQESMILARCEIFFF